MALPFADISDIAVSMVLPGNDSFMSHHERAVLVGLLRSLRADTVVEIGVQRGLGAREFLNKCLGIRAYYGIDVEAGYRTGLWSQQSELPNERAGELVRDDPRFHLIVRPRGSLDLAPADLPICDVAIIDGDHSAACLTHDTRLASDRVRPGGLIVWHDYWPPFDNDVVKFLDGLREKGRDIRWITNTWLALELR
jgi:predicted O-methyltransferase YrrM